MNLQTAHTHAQRAESRLRENKKESSVELERIFLSSSGLSGRRSPCRRCAALDACVVFVQDYQCWCDLRKLESMVGQRYLTHESDDARWETHRTERKLPAWDVAGFKGVNKNDIFKMNKNKERPGNVAR